MTNQLELFATTPKGLELLLVDELLALGASSAQEKLAGVQFRGDLNLAYKACLWSRLANRILLRLHSFSCEDEHALYDGIKEINWHDHIELQGSFAVHFVTSQSTITHTLYGAQKSKDAIVDQFRDRFDERPNVDRDTPDVSVYVYLYRNVATVYLDLSGDSLHKRGYRLAGGAAPLKENLAAAILIRAGWPAIAKAGGTLMDPMCGSGTLLIEAALMAADSAPGLHRDYFGFLGWKKHEPTIWKKLLAEAHARWEVGIQHLPTIIGYDRDPEAISIAFENIERAKMRGKIHVEKRELAVFAPKLNATPGLVVTNPPYGERLGELEELQPTYTLLAERLKAEFSGWKAAVFTGNPDLGKQMGLRAKKYYALFNGSIPCKLLLFDVEPMYFIDRSPEADNARRIRMAIRATDNLDNEAVQMFINRVTKNLRNKKPQANDELACRIYDADIPEYAFAIDLFSDHAEVVEYQAPTFLNPKKILIKQQQVLAALPALLDMPAEKIFFKVIEGNE